MKNLLFGLLACALTFLSGCANSDDRLQLESARQIGGMKSADVQLSNIDRGINHTNWTATTPKGTYDFEADDMLRHVNMVKRESK